MKSKRLTCDNATARFPDGRRGTDAGYMAHKKAGEDPCLPCRQAHTEASRRWRRTRYLNRREKNIAWQREYDRERGPRKYRENETRHPSFDNQTMLRAAARREAKRRNLRVENYSLDDITQAHGSTCYLCQRMVDLSLDVGALSPVVSYVVPFAQSWSPGDVLENVRWAHHRCDVVKGDRTPDQVLNVFPKANPNNRRKRWRE